MRAGEKWEEVRESKVFGRNGGEDLTSEIRVARFREMSKHVEEHRMVLLLGQVGRVGEGRKGGSGHEGFEGSIDRESGSK